MATVVVMVIVVVVAAVTLGDDASDDAVRSSPTAVAPAGPGAELYAESCAVCHGPNREGGVGPELSAARMVADYPDVADQIAVVLEGVGDMNGLEGTLTVEQIRAVVEYTRQG